MVAKDFLVDLGQKAHDGGDVECIERRAFVPAGENPPFFPSSVQPPASTGRQEPWWFPPNERLESPSLLSSPAPPPSADTIGIFCSSGASPPDEKGANRPPTRPPGALARPARSSISAAIRGVSAASRSIVHWRHHIERNEPQRHRQSPA